MTTDAGFELTSQRCWGKELVFPTGHMTDDEFANTIANGRTTLFIGPNGTGKTSSIRDYCDRNGIELAVLDCANIDPNIDLIGIPVPNPETGTFDMIRSQQIQDAQVIFFDEVNRADERVINALMSLANSGEIHGQKLPNLKCVFAAMNPVDGDEKWHGLTGHDYMVNDVDTATLDRYASIQWIPPVYNVYVIAKNLGSEVDHTTETPESCQIFRVAQAVLQFLNEDLPSLDEEGGFYVSPRRAEHIAGTFLSGASEHLVFSTLVGATYSPNDLWSKLTAALNDNSASRKDSMSAAAEAKSGSMDVAIQRREANAVLRKIQKVETPEAFEEVVKDMTIEQIEGIKEAVSAGRLVTFRQETLPENATETHLFNTLARQNNLKFNALMKAVAPSRGDGRVWFSDLGLV